MQAVRPAKAGHPYSLDKGKSAAVTSPGHETIRSGRRTGSCIAYILTPANVSRAAWYVPPLSQAGTASPDRKEEAKQELYIEGKASQKNMKKPLK